MSPNKWRLEPTSPDLPSAFVNKHTPFRALPSSRKGLECEKYVPGVEGGTSVPAHI
jgi:hypothetical protein